jgi:hypothetical protein
MMQVPYEGPTNYGHHHTNFSPSGELVSGICAPMFLAAHIICVTKYIQYINCFDPFVSLSFRNLQVQCRAKFDRAVCCAKSTVEFESIPYSIVFYSGFPSAPVT